MIFRNSAEINTIILHSYKYYYQLGSRVILLRSKYKYLLSLILLKRIILPMIIKEKRLNLKEIIFKITVRYQKVLKIMIS